MSAEQNQRHAPVVLITGARAPVALELCRHFAQQGWRVVAADSMACPLARFSKSVARYYRLPAPRHETAAFSAAVLEIVRGEKPLWIVPTCEEIFYLSRLHGELPVGVKLFAADAELLGRLHHKAGFLTMLAGCPVQAPESRLIEKTDTPEVIAQRWPDYVLKPVYSRFASRTLVKPTREVALKAGQSLGGEWIAQQFIAGEERCSYSVAHDGRVVAHACYRPLLRAGPGAGVYFEPEDAPDVRAFVEVFVAKHRFTGQVGFDFIRTDAGQLFVLECNPRATSGAHLFATGGLVRAITGEGEVEAVNRPAMIGVACVLYAWKQLGRLAKPWRVLSRARDVVWSMSDPWPFLLQGAGLLETAGVALRKRLGLRAATTDDIEWNGEP